MISGIFTSLALIGFLGVTAWAYSRRNKARFDDASQLPLTDEPAVAAAPKVQGGQELPPCCRGEKK